jgi:hypothetical protein
MVLCWNYLTIDYKHIKRGLPWKRTTVSCFISTSYQLNKSDYYMAFQNSLFWSVDKRSVKTHIRTVVRIFRIWTGVLDVVYLAENFCFVNRKKFCFLNFQLCFTDKNFKQPNCFWLSMHAYRILLPSETDDSRFNSREKHICSQTQFSHIINRLLTSLVRSVLWNIRPLFFSFFVFFNHNICGSKQDMKKQ